MNNIISKIHIILFACVATFMLSSCDKEDYTDYGTLTASDPTFTITWDGTALPASQVESDMSYPFTVTLSEQQIADLTIKIAPTAASTATMGDDFDVTSEITIPAYSRTGSGVLTVYSDVIPEEAETVAFQVGGESTLNCSHSEVVTLGLDNLVEPGLLLIFDWNGPIDATIGGTAYEGLPLCGNVDMDYYLLDADGNDTGDYTCATGACPEVYDMATWSQGDGTFYFAAQLYATGGVEPDSGPIPFPTTMTIAETGVVYIPTLQDVSTNVMSDNVGGAPVNILKVVVAGNNFSFYDAVSDALIYSN